MRLSIFPDLRDRDACVVNLNDYAKKYPRKSGKSPFLKPSLTDRFLAAVHRQQGVAYSFGGYLEDRRDLWRGSYLSEEFAVHLGIDINVPAGTEVSVARLAQVEKIIHDPDQCGGWGTVIMFRLEQPQGEISHFLYAHLAKESVRVKVGDIVDFGDIVGNVGQHHENGGWYEHMHVQALTQKAWDMFHGDLKNFDGYASQPQGKAHPHFPDPAGLL